MQMLKMPVQSPANHLKVAIIGGGPGGLSTAIALSQIPRIEVVLFEQAKLLREVGAGISVGSNTWNVLELLGVADTLTSGHETSTILNMNGRTGEELHRLERAGNTGGKRPSIRTQRTQLQSSLLHHVKPGIIHLSKRLVSLADKGAEGVELRFQDGTVTTAWWHGPTTHVFLSPVGEGLGEIAARAWHDPAVHSVSKVSWGVPVKKAQVESHFEEYIPQIRQVLGMVAEGDWREFAAFSGPELSRLTAWGNKIVLVGDSSHALSGAFGSGAGFAMEDAYILARTLEYFGNDVHQALPLFDTIRVPYYSRMYEYLVNDSTNRAHRLKSLGSQPSYDEHVRAKVIKAGGSDMSWIYENDIGYTWTSYIKALEKGKATERT